LPGVRLKNFFETAPGSLPGFSKFMILELIVALVMFVVFTQFAKRIQNGAVPAGRFWNLIDTFLTFLRDQVVRPSIGEHDADRFLPFIYTLFLFVLGCNLTGMVPWAGSPTGEFAVTLALAGVTLLMTIVSGVKVFGPIGFIINQAPDLAIFRPFTPMSLVLIPVKIMLLAIELLGLHGVLAIRLLANIVAGHLVLTAIMGIAAAAGTASVAAWAPAAIIVVLGCVLLSILELFVAFLQAYVFCFLASLFIGAAVHHH
jgi:F-type H+-transporting ATPase subunit a